MARFVGGNLMKDLELQIQNFELKNKMLKFCVIAVKLNILSNSEVDGKSFCFFSSG